MNQHERAFFVAKIDVGYIKYKKGNLVLKIYPPTKDVLLEAEEIFLESYNDAQNSDAYSEEEVVQQLIKQGIWDKNKENDFEKLPKHIDNLKVGLYETMFKSLERDKIRGFINEARNEYKRLYNIRHSWDNLTAIGVASLAKAQYIIENSTFQNGVMYDWKEVSPIEILSYYQDQLLTESEIRELARNEPWNSIWAIRKLGGKIFDGTLTLEQKSLIIWSMTYDSVNECVDRPAPKIIEDDDALDGWFIVQKRKREGEESQSKLNKILSNPNLARAQEIFLPAETKEDVREIELLNDTSGQISRAFRFKRLSEQKEISYGEEQQTKMKSEIERLKYGGI